MFAHWSASWPVLIGYVAVAGWHLAGLRRLTAAASSGGSESASRVELRREAAVFHLGLLVPGRLAISASHKVRLMTGTWRRLCMP